MLSQTLVAVRLDDARFGAGPATVLASVATVGEYLARFSDRDGARDASLRLWKLDGTITPGDRVVLQDADAVSTTHHGAKSTRRASDTR